ncbi:MAG: serine hydrolase [Bacteroidetes bacterium]|jgi:CubicO group peptidase (beta-lactamase class C family)|nr:serine hydrolase [Bacteroidota bacterium]
MPLSVIIRHAPSLVQYVVLIVATVLAAGACTPSEVPEEEPEAPPEASEPVDLYTRGLASSHLEQARERGAALPRLHGMVVARHGEILFEERFGGPALSTPVNVKSVSKSLLSALVGIAIDEGHLRGPDQRLAPFFEEYLDAEADPRKRDITVAHLLSMRSGLERTSGGNYGAWVSSSNWVRYKITQPLQADPGTERSYSTGNSHLLSAVLTQATGQSTWAYAQSALAEPLGIRLPQWPADPQGIYFGGNDMMISPRDLIRVGELYRNGGYLDGQRILPQEWVRASFRPRATSRWSGAGYGYGWFSSYIGGHLAYYGWGYGGQYLYVLPGLELTIAITSDPYNSGGRGHRSDLQRIVAEEIVPAAIKGADAEAGAMAAQVGATAGHSR